MKNILKKTLAIFLAVVMTIGIAPLSGSFAIEAEAEELTEGYYTYEVSDGEAIITACDQSSISGDVVIPSTIGGYPVTGIANRIFTGDGDIETATIPESITDMVPGVFNVCKNLREIIVDVDNQYYCNDESGVLYNKDKTELLQYPIGNSDNDFVIPDSVTNIGPHAFSYAVNLTSVTFGKNVESMVGYAFFHCENLKTVTMNDGLKTLGQCAFGRCTSLESVVIPDSVTAIEDSMFVGCESLESVTIGNGVSSIGFDAFYECNKLSDVYYNGTEEDWNKITIDVENECLTNATIHFVETSTPAEDFEYTISDNEVTITGYTGTDADVIIPAEIEGYPVTNIGSSAFDNCTSLASITIPDSVTSIGHYAFWYCTSLTSVTIPDSVTRIVTGAFSDCTSLTSVTIGNSVKIIFENAFAYCPNLEDVYYTGDIESWCGIKFGDFYANPMYYAEDFYIDNTLVEEVVIPDTITEIKDYTFCGFEGITSVTLPDSIESIGRYAFYKCTSLASVIIPDSVTSIGTYAFYGCNKLEDVYYTGDIESWCGITFGDEYSNSMLYAKNFYMNNTLVEEIVIPDTVTEIKDFAFCFFEGIASVIIPDSVESIGVGAFAGCESLTSVTIPDSVTSVGYGAFSDCKSLASVTIPDSITSIGNAVFAGCESLTTVTIPDSVTSVGYGVFSDCKSLASVTIPDSVTSIGDGAFGACTSLTSVCYEGTESQWNEIKIHDGNECLVNAEITFLGDDHEHHYESTVVAPTCTETGLETFTCRCGHTYTEVIPATGHTWSKWIVTAEPTEADSGLKGRFCTSCDDAAEIEVIPATGSGDDEKTGITITLKDENGNVIIKEIVSDYNTDISFEDGTYTLTISMENYVSRTYTVTAADNMMSLDFSLNKIGDMNGDGKVNTVDVSRANSHAKGVSSLAGYDFACVDVNGDGKVNTVDVAKMNSHAKGVSALW